MSTGRAMRIDEMIREGIASGHKFTVRDMTAIQQDDTDVIARDLTPTLLSLARSVRKEFSADERAAQEQLMAHLEGWAGKFDEKNIGATVYSYTILNLYQSLFHN